MNLYHWHPSVVVGLLALVSLYALGLGRRRADGLRASAGKALAFLGGILGLAGALLGPLAEWAEHVALSAHMAQHLLLALVVPPLLLLGTPAGLLRPGLRIPGVAPIGWLVTRPGPAFALSSATLLLWHVPVLYEAALEREGVHILEHLTLLATSVVAWWPIVGPLPEWPRPSPPAQLLYLFLCTLPMTVAAAPITLAEDVLYPFYARAGAPWPLSPRADQELAGILMWMGGMLGYLITGTVVFFRWARHEAGEEAVPG